MVLIIMEDKRSKGLLGYMRKKPSPEQIELLRTLPEADGVPEMWADPDEEDYEPPPMSKPGRILVNLLGPGLTGVYRYESEVLDYDSDSSVMWLNEGIGFEYFFDTCCDFPSFEGVYVIEGIIGHYYRGTYGVDDDDEEWEYASIRPATPEEISSQTLD